jgi:hypothetical protein
VAVQAHEQVFEVVHVARDLAVKGHEDLAQKEKDVDADGVGHGFGQGSGSAPYPGSKLGDLADEQAQQDQQGRSGGKGRCQKARRQNGGEPEVTPGQAAVQVGGHRVDAHGPGNGYVDQRFEPALVVGAVALGFQDVPAHHGSGTGSR